MGTDHRTNVPAVARMRLASRQGSDRRRDEGWRKSSLPCAASYNYEHRANSMATSRNNPVLFNDPFGLSPLSNCVWACVKINYGLSRDAGAMSW
jgi:hypothetical protein